MDIEAPIRAEVRRVLEPFFECTEEVVLATSTGEKRADIIAISSQFCSEDIIFAVEVKSHANDDPGKYKDALYQASQYVGARITDKRFRLSNDLSVDASIVFPAPAYVWHGRVSENDGREYILTGLSFFAERLKVGRLAPYRKDWEIVFGPNNVWSMKKGWMGEAKSKFPTKGIQSYVDVQKSMDSIHF